MRGAVPGLKFSILLPRRVAAVGSLWTYNKHGVGKGPVQASTVVKIAFPRDKTVTRSENARCSRVITRCGGAVNQGVEQRKQVGSLKAGLVGPLDCMLA